METTSTPAKTTSGLAEIMRQHPLTAYFVMAYAFSWIMVIPFILAEWHVLSGDWRPVFVLKPFVGPALAAYIMLRLTEGKTGWLRLRHSIVQWRESWKWYAFCLVVFPAFFFLGIALIPGALASFQGVSTPFLVSLPITFVVYFFFGGPLGEEIGWRGYALPRLQARYAAKPYGILRASLLLGVLWTFWHLPDFLTSAQHGGPAAGLRPFVANLPIFLLMVIAITLVFTLVYNRTHGSTFMAIFLHTVVNTLGIFVPLFPIPAILDSEIAMLIGWGALGLLIIVLTKGKLGYKAEEAASVS